MGFQFWNMVSWVLAASAGGFAVSWLFAGVLKLPRNRFLVPYVIFCIALIYTFITLNDIDVATLIEHNWGWGVLAGLIASVFLIRNVRTQPASRHSSGVGLIFELIWSGLIYGWMDALLLNAFPVVAMSMAMSEFDWPATLLGKMVAGTLGLLASVIITVAYHFGFPEYRNQKMAFALVGNTIMTLAVLLSGNPLAGLISHPVMHIAAVVQGADTTVQLPPHYPVVRKQG